MGDPGGERVFGIKPNEKLVQRQEEVGIFGEAARLVDQLDPDRVLSPLEPPLRTSRLNHDASHGLGGGEEVTAAVELLIPNEAQVSFVNECSRN